MAPKTIDDLDLTPPDDSADLATWLARNFAILLDVHLTSEVVESIFSRTGVVTAEQADYDGWFLTPAEGNAAYLGIGAKAADSELLDGLDGSAYAVKADNESITGEWNFNAASQVVRRSGPSGFTTVGAGWYQIAKASAGAGRGSFDIQLYTHGGLNQPQFLRVVGHKDYSVAAYFDQIYSSSNQYWTGVRIVDDTALGDAYVEVYFTQAMAPDASIWGKDAMHLDRFVIQAGALTPHDGAHTVRFTQNLTTNSLHVPNLVVQGNIALSASTDKGGLAVNSVGLARLGINMLSLLGENDNTKQGGFISFDTRTTQRAISFHTRQPNSSAEVQSVVITNIGNVGIKTLTPSNPLAVNRPADGVIVDFESADIVEGNISISGNATSYNAFVGSHYTQLKSKQQELPVGAVVIATGEIIESSPVFVYDETENLVDDAEGIETVDIIVEEIQTEIVIVEVPDPEDETKTVMVEKIVGVTAKSTEHYFDDEIGNLTTRVIQKPVTKQVTKTIIRLKQDIRLDEKTGKLYKKVIIKTARDVTGVGGKEYFSYIGTTSIVGDKRIYGVWNSKMSDDAKGQSFGQDNLPVYLISQVGLYKVRVTDTNGDIEIGDWLETSNRPMEAQKQTSASKLNSTIGKALINVDWPTKVIDATLGYKWTLIPVIF